MAGIGPGQQERARFRTPQAVIPGLGVLIVSPLWVANITLAGGWNENLLNGIEWV